MVRKIAVAAAICALTLLNFFQFPGHTYLQADSQIYLPILEHIRDPDALANDLIAQRPHVSFTLYDELQVAALKLTGLPFHEALEGEQVLFRALGILGLYLIALSAGLSTVQALLVAAIVSLGATIGGPAVLSFEYEPTPRGFAVPLVFLAIGLTARGRYLGGAVAASAAFLLHAPTAFPFWAVWLSMALVPYQRRRKLIGVGVLAGAAAILWICAQRQGGSEQAMVFFTRIDRPLEALQRMRASYNWVSTWWRQWLPHYAVLYAATLLAVARIGKSLSPDLRPFAIGLPLIGIASVPASYLLLEKMKLALIPQFQPMRALLFVTVMAALLAAIAACLAITRSRYWEPALWLALAYLIPVNTSVTQIPTPNRIAVALALSALASAALWADAQRRNGSIPAVALAALAPFFVIPIYGNVINYPALHSPALEELSRWARISTPKSAVFLFPDAAQELYPGVFRAEALRAVYVDWKAGGQVNYFKDFGELWLSRWQDVMARPFAPADCAHIASLGVDFIILKPEHKMPGAHPVFENFRFVAYALKVNSLR